MTRSKMTRSGRSEEHTSELQSHLNIVCRLLLEKKNWCCMGRSGRWRRSATTTSSSRATPRRASTWPPTAPGPTIFFFSDTPTTEIYTLSLHDALPIFAVDRRMADVADRPPRPVGGAQPIGDV